MSTEIARDTDGPAGTYGCACVSRDARNCIIARYGWRGNFGAPDAHCDCLCHKWDEYDGGVERVADPKALQERGA